jgi:ankyrin repeat protein
VLSTILSMLSTQNRKVFLEVQAFFQAQVKQNPAYIPEFDELVSNFEAFVRNHFERVLIVVDALDECSERDCLAYALKHIYRNCTNVQILVTSRNEIDIARTFEEFPQSSIKEHDVALDIEKFVKAEISTRIRTKKLKLRDEQLADTIAESLVEGAKGMFQWVKCQIEHLCKLRNDKAIRRALKDLPKTLHDTYIRILEGIQEQSEDDIQTVQRVLRWLVRSARNMSLDELAECISIDPIGEETRMEFDAVTTDPEDVLEICGSLVSVSVDNYVSIAHYSAKEFLVSEDLKKRMPNFWVGGYEVESALATVCLKYLCYDDFAGGTLTGNDETVAKLEEYKALKYASHYWATHAFRSKKDGHQTESVVDLTMRLFGAKDEEGHKNFEQWKQIYYFKSSARSNLIPRSAMNPLSFASCFGLTESVQQLLRAGAPADCSVNLRLAASQGHIDVVKTFLSTVSSCSLPNSHTAFYAAAAQGHVEIVQLLLDEVITDINVRAGKDGTALQAAALEGRYEIVSLLLDRGADAKFPCKRWGTPLAAAAEKGHFRTVEVLLDHGVNPNGRGGWCCFPLISAVMGKNAAIIDLLLQRGANVNAQGGCHGCALMAAASKGMVDLVSKLVDFGAKVNDEDDKGSDALYAACTAGHLDVVNLLLQLGADVNAKGGKHRNALNAASAEGKVEIVKRLIEVGADIQVLDEHVGNALQLAAWKGHDDIVRIISDAGVDVNESGGQRGSALVAAATRGHDATIRLLFELGVKQGDTQEMVDALVFAAHEGHQSTAELLLGSGLTVEGPSYVSSMANPSPRTALEAATRKGHIDIVKLLIAHGTDVNSFNEGSSLGSPLLAAIDTAKPCIATINILLDAGADPNLPVESTEPSYGYPLPAAVITGNLEIVKLLIARGAKINEVHGLYFTAMQFAAGQENPIILDYFLSNGGDVNLAMVPGANYPITPLQQAAHDGQEANVRKLISLGAELSVDNEEACYKNALQAASAQGHVEVVRTLVELGCDVNEIGGYYGTSLIAAARFNHSEVVELLIDADAQVNIGNVGAEPMNALIAATLSEEDTNVIPLLIQKGADPNMKGGGLFQYPLHAAAEKNLEETVRHLIENGADVNATGGRYMTALQAAALHSHSEVMQILLENSANPCIIGGQYGTALTAAYTGGWVDAISILYKYGADNSLIGGCRTYHSAMGAAIEGSCQGLIGFMVNHCGYNLNLPYGKYGAALQHAIANERGNAVIDLFLRNGADVNNQGGHFGTPLTAAVYRGDKFAQEALFEHGADPTMEGNGRYINAMYGVVDRDKSQFGKFDVTLLEMLHSKGCDIHGRDDLHGTLIQRAAFNRKFNVVKKLVQWGVDPDAFPSSKYGSALQAAATSGHSQMLRYLVRKQINVNCKGGRLGNPLSAAVISCSTEDIEILLKKGADPNQRGGRYGYPLQAAALLGRVDVILLLLRYGSAINAVGGRYGTALQAAVVSGSLDAVKLLIEQAADPDIEAGMYRTALHAAALERCVDILGYLIDAGALITPIDRQRLVHQTAADLDAAEELLKDKEEVEDEVNDEEVDEEEEEVDEENEDKDDDDDEEENDSDEFNPLPWNVTSIPGFDELYAPAQITAEVVQRHISVDEEVLSDSVSDEESAIEKFLELTTVFEVVLVDVFE